MSSSSLSKKQNKIRNYMILYGNSEIKNNRERKYYSTLKELKKAYTDLRRYYFFVVPYAYKGIDRKSNLYIYDYFYFD